MMNRILIKYTLALTILICTHQLGYANRLDDISAYITRIKETEKADKLYPVRYGLDKIMSQPDLTVEEKRELLKAYQLLADAFKSYTHYRNAADVYFDYLQLQEDFKSDYLIYLKDSLERQNNIIAQSELGRISDLDKELAVLRNQQQIVSGIKQKYLTYGGFALIVILLVFVVLLTKRNKSINTIRIQLTANQQRIKDLYRIAAKAAMSDGGIRFSKTTAEEGIQFIDSFEAQKPQGVNWEHLKQKLETAAHNT